MRAANDSGQTTANGGIWWSFSTKRLEPTAEENSPAIQYDGWQGKTGSKANCGTYRVSKTKDDTVTVKFTGSSVKWFTSTGPKRGSALVTIDGVNKGTFDLCSAQAKWQVARSFNGLANKRHTLVIRVLGTKNPMAKGTNVVVDSFKVGTAMTQDDACAIRFNNWSCRTENGASGRKYRYNSKPNAVATYRFQGREISWITGMGPAFGTAHVTIDGTDKGSLNLNQPNPQWQGLKYFGDLTWGTHSIKIQVEGTGKAVVVDAFVAE